MTKKQSPSRPQPAPPAEPPDLDSTDSRQLVVPELSKEDKWAALELMWDTKEIRTFLIYWRDIYKQDILLYSHPRHRGMFDYKVVEAHAKRDLMQRLLDHAQTAVQTKSKRKDEN